MTQSEVGVYLPQLLPLPKWARGRARRAAPLSADPLRGALLQFLVSVPGFEDDQLGPHRDWWEWEDGDTTPALNSPCIVKQKTDEACGRSFYGTSMW